MVNEHITPMAEQNDKVKEQMTEHPSTPDSQQEPQTSTTPTEETSPNPEESSSISVEPGNTDQKDESKAEVDASNDESGTYYDIDFDDFEEEIIDIADLVEEDEYSPEERAEMERRYTETMRVFRSGELVMGKIVTITESDVAVDIGFKSEGSISLDEFDDPETLKVGDELEVCIDNIENRNGTLSLSKKKAEFYRVWEKINELYKTGEMVEAEIARRIKGGMVVDLFGIEAFLPGSQIDVHPVRDFDALVGAKMDFRIIKVNNARKNVVLSHKVLVEESLREIREKVLSELEEGQVVEGVVKNITDFGVFVDLGGVDGLLHITDLSWGRVTHPSDVVTLDEKITVKVLNYDKDKRRISLGLKQLKEHHWDEIEEKYPINNKVTGKVVSIVKYGAFVELEEGVEGLVHISEMSWTQHIKHPSQMVNVGDEIEVIVLNIDRENRKVSLGMKQVDEDPWERLEQVFLHGTRHKGVVRDLVPFGAFVELEPGIDGLIHISDLSWTRKVRHPGEIVKKGQEIEVVILNFDKNERRIALGFKQLEADPWDDFEKAYPIRARTEGSVIRVLEKGVVVMLPLGVEGFIPNSQLGKTLAGDNKKKIKEGDNLELEVIEFDKSNHRIVLSHSTVERTKEKNTYRAYRETTDEGKTTIGDIIRKSGQIDDVQKQPKTKDDDSSETTETENVEADTAVAEAPPAEAETVVDTAEVPATEEAGETVAEPTESAVTDEQPQSVVEAEKVEETATADSEPPVVVESDEKNEEQETPQVEDTDEKTDKQDSTEDDKSTDADKKDLAE